MYRTHWFNGVGARGFREAFAACDPGKGSLAAWGEGPALHAHQWVLEVASETGTFGLVMWLAGLALGWRAWRYVHAGSRANTRGRRCSRSWSRCSRSTRTWRSYSTFWGGLVLLLAALYAGSLLARDAEPEEAPRVSGRAPISGVVTTFNNAATLDACLASLAFCDERIVLDSGSTDATREIAERHGARIAEHPFEGYGPQKQRAIDMARHDWVLLLDADEHLTDAGREMRSNASCARRAPTGYRLPRQEWLFWKWAHLGTRANWQLRLFRKSRGRMNDVPVHAAPVVDGVDATSTRRSAITANRGWPIASTR